jgi:hypothetical protein
MKWKGINGERGLSCLLAVLSFISIFLMSIPARIWGEVGYIKGEFVRITFTRDEVLKYPSMDREGHMVVYRSEKVDTKGEKRSSVEVISPGDKKPKLLFEEGRVRAPKPMDGHFLILGTKPPVISGDGKKVVFSLSLGAPLFIDDHYLGVVNTDGTDFRVIEIVNEEIKKGDFEKWGFTDNKWRTISQYRITDDGKTIACLVKGHMGGRKVSTTSAIVLVSSDGSSQKTLIAPRLEGEGWVWDGYPRNPFLGGGWIFDLTGDGKGLIFGAQSGPERTDYDIYFMEIDGKKIKKLTDIKDRWFVRGAISSDGKVFCFFYSGKKLNGIGTYILDSGMDKPIYLRSRIIDRVSFEAISGNGKRVFYRASEGGLAFTDLVNGNEGLIKQEGLNGPNGLREEVSFPSIPSFWSPRFVSMRGDKLLLEAYLGTKDKKEIFLLRLPVYEKKEIKRCSVCGRVMEEDWKYCPFDGTSLIKGKR